MLIFKLIFILECIKLFIDDNNLTWQNRIQQWHMYLMYKTKSQSRLTQKSIVVLFSEMKHN